jgi:hypothetical protein
MDQSVAQFLEQLRASGLADRDPTLVPYQKLAEAGMLPPGIAKCLLIRHHEQFERQKDFPNLLHRPPTHEQLYADGKPDVEVGSLIEGEQLRFGIRLCDKPRHVLAAGATGGGKTTLIRNLILGIEALNERNERQETDPSDNH